MGLSNQIPSSRLIQPGVIENAASRPASPFEGQCIFQKDTDQLLVWNGTAWVIPNQTTTNPEGLELIKTQTVGTAVTSVLVSDAFSSTYDNYLIRWNGGAMTSSSGDSQIGIRMASQNSGYYQILNYALRASNSTPRSAGIENGDKIEWIGGGSTAQADAEVVVSNPFLNRITKFTSPLYTPWDLAGFGSTSGFLNNTTSYTSFTLVVTGTGTMTGGTIRVYGYRNS
jgi:hypothetical protein